MLAFAVGRGTVEEPRGSHNFYTLSAVHQLHCLVSRSQLHLEKVQQLNWHSGLFSKLSNRMSMKTVTSLPNIDTVAIA